jgi:hypothetical protein
MAGLLEALLVCSDATSHDTNEGREVLASLTSGMPSGIRQGKSYAEFEIFFYGKESRRLTKLVMSLDLGSNLVWLVLIF